MHQLMPSFNSRTREGCDVGTQQGKDINYVSIHAPGRGATPAVMGLFMYSFCFNSRTREGCDDNDDLRRRSFDVSIHAPGRGATVALTPLLTPICSFNSRTREGCDSMVQSCVLWGG